MTAPAPARGLHRAWWVALVTFLVLLAAASFRASMGVLLVPLEAEFGWTRAELSLAASVNLVVYGVTAPFAAALMEQFGVKRVVVGGLALISAGTGLSVFMTASWQLVVLWGLAVGLGTGATALVFGALVANRWFVSRRGLVVGFLGTAWATGQLVFLPLLAALTEAHGWRSASLTLAAMSALLIPVVLLVFADRPADVGLLPYGADADAAAATEAGSGAEMAAPAATRGTLRRTASGALGQLRDAARGRAFWLLAGTFFICGWTTNGIISTHWIPAAHDHGLPATTAAGLLAVVGICDVVGSLGSGWLTDRVDPRILLSVYYTFRGVAMLAVPVLLGPTVDLPIVVVVMLFGFDWVATVPPTVTLCREAYGVERGAVVFGWVFAAHMIGAAVAAVVSGAIRDALGDYGLAWVLAGVLALAAAFAAAFIPRPRVAERTPVPSLP